MKNYLPGLANKPAQFVAHCIANGLATVDEIRASVSEQVAAVAFTLCGKDYRAALGYGLDRQEAAKYARACSRLSA